MEYYERSKAARSKQPMVARTLGFVCGQEMAVWSNWDRFEVRTEQHHLVLHYESNGPLLHWNIEFVGNRYLILPIGTGIMCTGFKVYDFHTNQWIHDVVIEDVEIGFCGMHPSAPIIAIEENDGLSLWDLASGQQISRMSILEGINVAAFNEDNKRIAAASYESVQLFDEGRKVSSMEVAGGDVSALAWHDSKSSLLCGNAAGDIVQIDYQTQKVTHVFSPMLGSVEKIRIAPNGKSAIVIGDKGQACFINLENMQFTRQEDVFDAVFFADDASSVLTLGATKMRRITIST